ncbi:MAG: hypothetical protein ABI977_25650 [Acidobacteriota bacterium]
MASPQFIHLLDQLHKTSQRRQLPWQPIRKYGYSSSCDFRIALGDGIVYIHSNDDDEHTLQANYQAYLTTRDGLLVDEVVARQHESDYYPMLREIHQQARIGAFKLDQMVDVMQNDLESGVVRELPEDKFEPHSDIPF